MLSRLCVLLLVASVFCKRTDITVIGHRGHGCSGPSCISQIPENSIPAYLAGRAEGADRVELDTWLTADNQIIVVHGGAATTHGSLVGSVVNEAPGGVTPLVEQTNYENITEYHVKMPWVVEKPAKGYETDSYRTPYQPYMHLPLFKDVLKAVCPTGAKIQVEMKGNNPNLAPALIALLQEMDLVDCVHGFSSFYWGTYNGPIQADLFKPIVGKSPVPLFLLFNLDTYQLPSADQVVEAVRAYNASGIHPCFDQFDEPNKTYIIQRAAQEGFAVMSWTPGHRADTPDEMRHLIDKGLKEICTNNPGQLRRILDAM
ncbi:hypothetical protein PAPYR_8363 [Paratrimastix pyriformis]|uniref:GP-PDE domain-containing protein n=1 Tax=Paratrimastix pyriformis TaxID=342808 RepID=A0ABQ8UC89_9EUKA|nr:hypothetical protein PAPYR_8363 [Paratrimastix pyriformis]|eukprot:GAFH01002953.1.p2 GENE.GAFH01002953.1~~GAFH01002953.1.p2  ORF type:complete len:315 (-),score=80.49 GAFH01002953.1:93-1037(-)